ncbi:hypothetical protein B4077_3311 [Bacillus cereus]|uniref:Uncharacterized protein n=1 Tax=Bacillus cereus TaxID=1396 RepID=A0A0G8F3G2_BACCE|nr:hypothetical protein B4077_3311 [Bacillus cereus]
MVTPNPEGKIQKYSSVYMNILGFYHNSIGNMNFQSNISEWKEE